MKIFVTGASGFIGSAVVAALARAGHRVVGLTRSKEKARAIERSECEALVGNLDDAKVLESAVARCEVVVHCAAEISKRHFELDRQALAAMLAAAHRVGRPRQFVYTSGVWVYGDTGATLVDESDELRPTELVVERLQSEKIALEGNRAHVRTSILRPGCVYGGQGSLTARWFETAGTSGAAEIVGEGANRWAMIHRDDLADAYVRVVEAQVAGEIFNVVDRSRPTVRECASAASRAVGANGAVRSIPLAEAAKKLGAFAKALALDQNVDASKLQHRLGWNPRQGGFVDGVERYARAWRAANSG